MSTDKHDNERHIADVGDESKSLQTILDVVKRR
jgi:hypothetical protein